MNIEKTNSCIDSTEFYKLYPYITNLEERYEVSKSGHLWTIKDRQNSVFVALELIGDKLRVYHRDIPNKF